MAAILIANPFKNYVEIVNKRQTVISFASDILFQVLLVAAVIPSLGQRGTGGQQGGGRGGGGQQGRSKGGGRGGVGKGGGQTKPVPSKPKLIFGGFEPVGEGRGLRFPGGKISSASNDWIRPQP